MKKYLWPILLTIASILFAALVFYRKELMFEYSYKNLSWGSLVFLLYWTYLVCVACLAFREAYLEWKEGLSYKGKLIKACGLTALFLFFHTIIYYTDRGLPEALDSFHNLLTGSSFAPPSFHEVVIYFYIKIPNLLFPIGLYVIFLSYSSVAYRELKGLPLSFTKRMFAIGFWLSLLGIVSFGISAYGYLCAILGITITM
ncbi:MAG: hypothetical protein PHU71_01175 [Candidatus Gracilibacteria bacterium]|nr:hypothetical protein [Candidatus Gracilibacteria bacterium]